MLGMRDILRKFNGKKVTVRGFVERTKNSVDGKHVDALMINVRFMDDSFVCDHLWLRMTAEPAIGPIKISGTVYSYTRVRNGAVQSDYGIKDIRIKKEKKYGRNIDDKQAQVSVD